MAKDEFNYIWTDKKRTIFGLPISFTRYYITETKLITQKGFFTIEEDEIELYKIIDKSMSRTLFQRMFNCGTITIHSKDIDTPTKKIESVKNARKVLEILDEYMNKMRDKYNIRGRDMINYGEPYNAD